MRLPNSAHESHPWRIREIASDFELEDVWALPVEGDAEEFQTLLELMAASDLVVTTSGDTCTEHVDFIDVEGGQGLNGTDVKFTVKVSGDTLTQTGNLGGTNMKEVWKRLP